MKKLPVYLAIATVSITVMNAAQAMQQWPSGQPPYVPPAMPPQPGQSYVPPIEMQQQQLQQQQLYQQQLQQQQLYQQQLQQQQQQQQQQLEYQRRMQQSQMGQ